MTHTQQAPHSRYAASSRHFDLRVDERGRVVIPVEARKHLGLGEDDRIILRLEPNGTVTLFGLRKQVRELQGMFADLDPGTSWSEELIEERRKEARREAEEEDS